MKIKKEEVISFLQTFSAFFVVELGYQVSQVSFDKIMNGDVLTWAFVIGLVVAAARSAVKLAWQKIMPVSLGGKK